MISLRLLHLWTDKAYLGEFVWRCAKEWDITVEVVRRLSAQVGFQVILRRRVVERTFAWLGRSRRLSKDHERRTDSSEGFIYLATLHTLLNRLPV